MENYYNKHYIDVDDHDRILYGWSDGPYPEKDTTGAICINEQGGYQFRLYSGGEENPPLQSIDGIPLYKWEDSQVVLRTEEEIISDRAAIPAPTPTEQDRFEAQLFYTAMKTDTLIGESL